jgi:hypothetical protein
MPDTPDLSGNVTSRGAATGRRLVALPRAPERAPGNLPQELSSFVGREHEISEVEKLLAEGRLLTLTGSGGCGKTRLALKVADDLASRFEDGVWLVELASLTDPALVPQTVAFALGVREQPGRPLTDTLSDHLELKKMLLVLDNCEYLVAACARLAEALLRACPKVRILATSREALGVPGEIGWLVLPSHCRIPVICPPSRNYPGTRRFVSLSSGPRPWCRLSNRRVGTRRPWCGCAVN